MIIKKKTPEQNAPRGRSRAAQNKKIRQDALREELKARVYIRQLVAIEKRLDPDNKQSFNQGDIPMVKERVSILFRMLDKCLPNLRPVDMPVKVQGGDSITEQGAAIIKAMTAGDITPSEATTIMQSIASQARIIEVDELEKRVTELEANNGN